MRRLVTLLLAAGMTLSTFGFAQAADISVKGVWDFAFEATNVPPRSGDSDRFGAVQRFRTQIDVVASESLKGVVFFEIGDTNWGKASEGGALGTDAMNVAVRYSYIDWVIPQTSVKVRMGLQPIILPGFVAHSPIYGHDTAGITVSTSLTDQISASLFWGRPYNDNYFAKDGSGEGNAMDLLGLTLPMTFDGVKATPWVMYGFMGANSLRNLNTEYELATVAPRGGLSPVLGSGQIYPGFEAKWLDSNREDRGDGIWVGLSGEITAFNPFTLAADIAYGYVDMGTIPHYTGFNPQSAGKDFDLVRSGWYTAVRAEYDLGWGTPGMIAWYGSGDDSNPYNGSERLPQFNAPWYVSALGFGGGYNDLTTWKVLGHNPGGLWGVVLRLKDMSFMEDLLHTVRAGYFRGTNSSDMPKNANMTVYPNRADGPMAYLTTKDDAWEVNFDTRYKIYKNLEIAAEAAYVRLNLDEGTWGAARDSVEKDNYRTSISLRYSF